MKVEKEIIQTLFDLFLNLSKEVARESHKYIGSHNRIIGYEKYPVIEITFPKDNPEYSKYYENIPFLKYNIPRYELHEFPKDKIQYGVIFDFYRDDIVNIINFSEFDYLFEYITNTPELKGVFNDCKINEDIKYKIKSIVLSIVERYLYSTNATYNIPENLENQLKPFVREALLRYINSTLDIDICVPICLASFQDEIIKLSDQIEIVRISDSIQKSRKKACTYDTDNEDWIAACATHMIIIHGYYFNNDEYVSIDTIIQNYLVYPLHVIDDIMAIIRIVTGYTIGYEQILSIPLGWIGRSYADLTPVYGAKAHFINAREIEKFWMQLPVSLISSKQSQEIQKLYGVVECYNDNRGKGNLSFALKRLNRCMLRDETDDMAIDATIGLESILSGGTKGEITYTISNRIPVVFINEQSEIYSPKNCRAAMKKIYNYRSIVVHGGTLKDKDNYLEIDGTKIEMEKIAVDFLRYTLMFVLHNPEYLEAKKFDDFIDTAISEKQ